MSEAAPADPVVLRDDPDKAAALDAWLAEGPPLTEEDLRWGVEALLARPSIPER